MKKMLILAAALLVASTARGQIGGGFAAGSLTASNFTSVTHVGNICNLGTGVDQRASVVTSAKNDGPFLPTSFQSYDEAIQAGRQMLNSKPANLGEIARKAREEKKAATQTAILVVVQDQRGRMIAATPQP